MKKTLFSLFCAVISICATLSSCSKEVGSVQPVTSNSDIKVELSATMPEFKSGEILDTKASMESVVRIRWAKNDRLAVINLSTKKVLGGCMIADNNGINTTFSSSNLVGTIHTGDKFVFILDNQSTIAGATEKDFEPFTIDISNQEGNADNVPIVVYAEYTATKNNEIEAVNLDFSYLVSYVQLAVSALPAKTTIAEISIDNIGNSCDFDITGSGTFKVQPKKGSITLTEDFSADGKGAKVRYFSCFESPAQSSAREAHISANGALHSTSWLKAGLSIGYYYQSVATGFTNENIQFVDEAFKAYCVSHYDLNGDGELSFAEAAAITEYAEFSSSDKSLIKNVYELPYFPAELGLPSFTGCTALTQILIPGTVTSIPAHTFENCTSLTDISLPSGVNSIGENAFKGCSNLKSFHGELATTDNRYLVKDGHLMAFASGDLTDIILPSNITVIDNAVFEGCSRLLSIILPKSLITIGDSAFKGCSEIKVMRLFENVSSIGNQAFKDCTSFISMFSDAVTPPLLGNDVFDHCNPGFHVSVTSEDVEAYNNSSWGAFNVSSTQPFNEIWYTTTDNIAINLPSPFSSNQSVIAHNYFGDKGVILFSGDVTSIGHLGSPSNLSSISFPEGFITLGSLALYNCRSLRTVSLPSSLRTIQSYAFTGCNSLEEIELNDGLTTIESWAFSGCSSLKSIDIPDSITLIPEYSFRECTNLRTLVIGDGVETIEGSAFAYCTFTNITIGRNVQDMSSLSCQDGANVFIDSFEHWCSLPYGGASGKYNLYIDNELLTDIYIETPIERIILLEGCISLKSVRFGPGIVEIPERTFYGCESLSDVTLNESMSIGALAFSNCKLTTLSIPSNCSIKHAAFRGNSLLTDLSFQSSIADMELEAFSYCDIREVTIPSGITAIPDYAFEMNKNLTSVIIPEGIETIGSYSFHSTNLSTVRFPSTLTRIKDHSFSTIDCYNLPLDLYFSSLVPPIVDDDAWYGIHKIFVPNGCLETYTSTTGWLSHYTSYMEEN